MDNIHKDKKLNFRMLMPFDSNRPIAPFKYSQWLFNADGFDGVLIRILSNFYFEEFDKFTYIWINDEQAIRYDIAAEIIYARECNYSEIEQTKTVGEIMDFLERIKCKAIVEQPHSCTYGLADGKYGK